MGSGDRDVDVFGGPSFCLPHFGQPKSSLCSVCVRGWGCHEDTETIWVKTLCTGSSC